MNESKNRKAVARLLERLQAPDSEALVKLVRRVVDAYDDARADGLVAGAAAAAASLQRWGGLHEYTPEGERLR